MNRKKYITILVLCIIAITIVATLVGIVSNKAINIGDVIVNVYHQSIELYGSGLYHNESISMATQVIAQDMVTLVIAIPTLAISVYLYNKGSRKGHLFLIGILGYFLYTYTSYSFTAMYNPFFLLYVIVMGLSFFAIVLCTISIDITALKQAVSSTFPHQRIAWLLLLFALLMSSMWLGRVLPSLTGTPPPDIGHYTTLVIQALDLGIIIPLTFLSGYLLKKEKALGYLLAPIMLVKGSSMLLAMDAMAFSMCFNNVTISTVELIVFPIFTAIFFYSLFVFMKNVRDN